MRDFCKISRIWKLWLGPYDLVADEPDYLLTPLPMDAVLHDIVHVQINETPDEPLNARDVYPYSEQATVLNVTPVYNRALGSYLSFSPAPQESIVNGLRVEVVLMPDITTTTCVLDILYNEHIEALEEFVKWKALIRPAEVWSNPELGAWHGEQYKEKAAIARNSVRSGNMTPRHRTLSNDFG